MLEHLEVVQSRRSDHFLGVQAAPKKINGLRKTPRKAPITIFEHLCTLIPTPSTLIPTPPEEGRCQGAQMLYDARAHARRHRPMTAATAPMAALHQALRTDPYSSPYFAAGIRISGVAR